MNKCRHQGLGFMLVQFKNDVVLLGVQEKSPCLKHHQNLIYNTNLQISSFNN